MTVRDNQLYASTSTAKYASSVAIRWPAAVRRWLIDFSLADWLMLAYLANLNFAAFRAPVGHARSHSLAVLGSLLGLFLFGVWLARGIKIGLLGVLAHRLAYFSAMIGSYLAFAQFLPLVNTGSLDRELYSLDLSFFGVEPAVYFDRFVTPWTSEWFAFFYFGYFFVVGLHVIPILFLARNDRLITHFTLGMLLVCCVGQSLYMVVPGFGPAHTLPAMFQHPLPDGIWWSWVAKLVAANGAQKDIFPSLHTALPLFLLLFSFDNRKRTPFTYTWPAVGFFVVNIIAATMFLRWHYVIDVVAGTVLATGAQWISRKLSHWEPARRAALGLGPPWPHYSP